MGFTSTEVIPVLDRVILQAMSRIIGGVIDQNRHGAVGLFRLCDSFLRGGDIGNVTGDEQQRMGVFRCHISDKCRGIRALDKGNPCPLLQETLSEGGANTGPAAGD